MKNTRRDESGKPSAIENKKTQNSNEFWVFTFDLLILYKSL
jgi:hypothetical protein